MHARAGYQHDGILNDAWAVMVDLVSIGFLLWVATGLYIWWQLTGLRWWGAAGLVAGLLSFAGLLLMLYRFAFVQPPGACLRRSGCGLLIHAKVQTRWVFDNPPGLALGIHRL